MSLVCSRLPSGGVEGYVMSGGDADGVLWVFSHRCSCSLFSLFLLFLTALAASSLLSSAAFRSSSHPPPVLRPGLR